MRSPCRSRPRATATAPTASGAPVQDRRSADVFQGRAFAFSRASSRSDPSPRRSARPSSSAHAAALPFSAEILSTRRSPSGSARSIVTLAFARSTGCTCAPRSPGSRCRRTSWSTTRAHAAPELHCPEASFPPPSDPDAASSSGEPVPVEPCPSHVEPLSTPDEPPEVSGVLELKGIGGPPEPPLS